MALYNTPYTFPLLIILFFLTAIIFYIRATGFFRQRQWAVPLLVLLIECMLWMFFNLLGLSVTDVGLKYAFLIAFYIVSLSIPLTWLVFALYYTGKSRYANIRNIALLSIIPFSSAVLAMASGAGGLVIDSFEMAYYADYSAIGIVYYGPWETWVQVPYSFLMVCFSVFLLIRFIIKNDHFLRWQAILFIAVQLIPLAIGIVYIRGINPFPHLEYTPIVMSLGILVVIALFMRSKQSEIMVLARSNILEKVESGIIVLDINDRIVDLNKKSIEILGGKRITLFARNISDVLSTHKRQLGTLIDDNSIVIEKEGKRYVYDIHRSDIKNLSGTILGKVIVLNDVTEEKSAIERLERLNKILKTLSSINRLIVREKDDSSLIQDICRCLVENRGYFNSLIVLFGKGKEEYEFAHTGLDDHSFIRLKSQISSGKDIHCIDKAVSSRQLLIIKDPLKDCRGCPVFEKYHCEGALAAPLLSSEKVYGALIASVPREYVDNSEEIEIFIEIANDIAFALRAIEHQDMLDEEKDKTANYLRVADVVIMSLDKNGDIGILNRKGYEILECEDLKLEGLNWFENFVPDDIREYAQRRFDELVSSSEGNNKYFEERLKTCKGRERLMAWHVSVITDREGNIAGTISSGEDITEKKKTEEALKSSEHFNSVVLNNSSNPISVIGPDRAIRYVNPAFERLTGYSSDRLIGSKPPFLYWPPEKTEYHEKQLDGCLKQGSSVKETQFIDKDKKRFWIESNSKAIFDEDGNFLYLLQNWIDITERKRSLKKIGAARDELKKSYKKLQKTLEDIITALGAVVESNDQYTANHQKNVSRLAVSIAKLMDLKKDSIELLRVACLIHDIGKIIIPVSILTKPGKLSDLEFELIKTHPGEGYKIISGIDFPWPVAQLILQHHERIDGSGYPNNLTDGDIMLEAKILAVADVVEAMSSHRPYRPSLGVEKALEEIRAGKDRIYDCRTVDACIHLFKDGIYSF